jgi:hypothetical protein
MGGAPTTEIYSRMIPHMVYKRLNHLGENSLVRIEEQGGIREGIAE